MEITHNYKGEIKISKRCVASSNHGPYLRMSNYNAFQPVRKNSQPSYTGIPCSEENVEFFIKDRRWIKRYGNHIFKLFFNKIIFIENAHDPFFWSKLGLHCEQRPLNMAHGFSHGLIQKVGYDEVLGHGPSPLV
jgi:hypothetical protein